MANYTRFDDTVNTPRHAGHVTFDNVKGQTPPNPIPRRGPASPHHQFRLSEIGCIWLDDKIECRPHKEGERTWNPSAIDLQHGYNLLVLLRNNVTHPHVMSICPLHQERRDLGRVRPKLHDSRHNLSSDRRQGPFATPTPCPRSLPWSRCIPH